MKPLSTNKTKTCSKIALNKKKNKTNIHTPTDFEEVISNNSDIARTFNKFFRAILPKLEISLKETFETNVDEVNYPILKEINLFKYHPSKRMVKSKENPNQKL